MASSYSLRLWQAKEVSDLLQMLKGNLKIIELRLGWSGEPIFERGSKTVNLDDLLALQKKIRLARLGEGATRPRDPSLLKDTNKKLKVSQGLPDWKLCGLRQQHRSLRPVGTVQASLNAMSLQLNATYL